MEADVSGCEARTPPDGARSPRHAETEGFAMLCGGRPSGPWRHLIPAFSAIFANGAAAAHVAPALT